MSSKVINVLCFQYVYDLTFALISLLTLKYVSIKISFYIFAHRASCPKVYL